MSEKLGRNSSLELLRIIAMLFIVFSHSCFYSGADLLNVSNVVNKTILQVFLLGNLGTAIFFIISGYFAYKSEFKIYKVVKLCLTVTFYSMIIFLILCAFNKIDFTWIGFIKALFPILFEEYWFITVYLIIYILSSFIKKIVSSLSRREYLALLIFLIITWSIIPTFTTYTMYSEPFGRSLIPYLVGMYFCMYPKNYFSNGKHSLNLTLGFATLILLSSIICNVLTLKNPVFNHGTMLLLPSSFAILFLAIGLFNLYLNKNFNNKIINGISSCVFGVYLIHNNQNITYYLWHDIVRMYEYIDKSYMIVHMIVCVILIYVICLVLDALRMVLFEKPLNNTIRNFSSKIETKINSIFNIFCKKVIE